MTWDIFKKAFLDRFFPREKKEAKVEEFIDLYQQSMSHIVPGVSDVLTE